MITLTDRRVIDAEGKEIPNSTVYFENDQRWISGKLYDVIWEVHIVGTEKSAYMVKCERA